MQHRSKGIFEETRRGKPEVLEQVVRCRGMLICAACETGGQEYVFTQNTIIIFNGRGNRSEEIAPNDEAQT
jgi:hypothetical protein